MSELVPSDGLSINCETQGHMWGPGGKCLFCPVTRAISPDEAAFDAAWQTIQFDPRLARARKVLSIADFRLITQTVFDAMKGKL